MSSKEDVKKIVEYEKKSHSKLLKDTQMVGREDLDLISILQDLERKEQLEKIIDILKNKTNIGVAIGSDAKPFVYSDYGDNSIIEEEYKLIKEELE